MARLDPLIKVRKQAVEDKQRFLADLYRQQEDMIARKEKILMDLAREQALVEADLTNLEARAWFGDYAQGAQKKISDLDTAMKKMETRIMIARDDVRAAFAEFKKIEITDRERTKREEKKLNDQINKDLDDQALENYRRQNQD